MLEKRGYSSEYTFLNLTNNIARTNESLDHHDCDVVLDVQQRENLQLKKRHKILIILKK